jgi:hypothetical protein
VTIVNFPVIYKFGPCHFQADITGAKNPYANKLQEQEQKYIYNNRHQQKINVVNAYTMQILQPLSQHQ